MSVSQSTRRDRKKRKAQDENRLVKVNDDTVSKRSGRSRKRDRFALMGQNDTESRALVAKGSSLIKEIHSLDDLIIDTSKVLG